MPSLLPPSAEQREVYPQFTSVCNKTTQASQEIRSLVWPQSFPEVIRRSHKQGWILLAWAVDRVCGPVFEQKPLQTYALEDKRTWGVAVAEYQLGTRQQSADFAGGREGSTELYGLQRFFTSKLLQPIRLGSSNSRKKKRSASVVEASVQYIEDVHSLSRNETRTINRKAEFCRVGRERTTRSSARLKWFAQSSVQGADKTNEEKIIENIKVSYFFETKL